MMIILDVHLREQLRELGKVSWSVLPAGPGMGIMNCQQARPARF